jgi:hypothetical protein
MDALRIRRPLNALAASRARPDGRAMVAGLAVMAGLVRLAPGALLFLKDWAWVWRQNRLVPSHWTYPVPWPEAMALLGPSWLLALGLLVARARWDRGLPSLTLALAVCAFEDLARLALRIGLDVPIRGFEVTPYLMRDRWAVGWRVLLLAIELAALRRAWPALAARGGMLGRGAEFSAIAGRLALFGSLVLLALVVGSLGWTVYEDVALESRTLRSWIATMPLPRRLEPRRPPAVASYPLQGTNEIREAFRQARMGRYPAARRSFVRGLNILERIAQQRPQDETFVRERARGWNGLAWLLATCPDAGLRDPARAEACARRALTLEENPIFRNTLAVALYRGGHLEASAAAFRRSMGGVEGGDAFDWLYLAMLRQDEGNVEEAQELFVKARKWIDARGDRDAELTRLEREAADHLGLEPPDEPTWEDRPDGTAREPMRASGT